MELQQIRYFLAIQEHGSFSRAARECLVSQPALTAAIKKLEAEIGSPLFFREGKRVVATPLGRLVQPALEQALVGTQSARDIAQNFRLLRQAPLRVGVMNTIGPVRLARFLDAYHRKHPGVELTVHDATLPLLQQQLEAGELDLAVVSSPQPLDDALRAEPLYEEPYVVVFAPGHHLQRLTQIRLADLGGEAYVDRLACEFREAVMAVCGQRQVELYAAFRSEREDWIEAMVMAGLGFAFMPQYSVRMPDLQQRPLVDPPVARTVMVADVRGRRRSPAAKLFVEELHAFGWTH
ncbi:MAG TPA: LysR substrate-binding domain-containing protein [Ramlibacter sp.]|nr:LysR substrate-binding domain-containing protein [Ramlibacter sp.]